MFTAPADPIDLSVTLEEDAAVTADIGSDGGTLTTTASDGSKFTLTIPENALPFDLSITMTPIETASGFPGDVQPTRNVGVSVRPDGLELAQAATLVIEPSGELPESDVYALSYRRDGEDAGVHLYERFAGGTRLTIDHFSGYELSFPIFIANEPASFVRKYMSQAVVEERLASEVAVWVTYLRQLEARGRKANYTLQDLAAYVLPIFKRLVISPRVAVADRSCAEAQAAISAYLMYERQRQVMGVAEDPAFDLVGPGISVPDALVDLAVQVCFKEAYERCRKTGEFPALGTYYLSFLFRVGHLGVVPKSEHVALARQHLTACGRWRVHVATTHIDDAPASSQFDHHEATREFHVQWKPGDGPFGIVGSTVEGSGPVETTKLDVSPKVCHSTVSNLRSTADATARITGMFFDHYEGPTLTGEPIPPVPTHLRLEVGFGVVSFHHGCLPDGAQYDTDELFQWQSLINGQARGFAQIDVLQQISEGTYTPLFDRDWRFDREPYRATTVQEKRLKPGGDTFSWTVYARTEIVVEHEPQ